ncbi:MAG: hypothetical protein AUI61_04430 [Thaumarchaeota archaeon 13_1_40CM_2_39_13_2]|nr:MAG: hypothetical protein AUI61_04430 [Thaumarchaeota archaeon 13_1_40CM_2_39_13_2]OLE43320.1 MAG: hypothetical protein AUF73_02710 [Thaumarchaeota archaeon 13_1_20CM_2_39_11]
MRRKTSNPKRRLHAAIGTGIIIVGIAIFVNYYLDQAKLSGQTFGDQLAQIQADLKNETQSFDSQLTLYQEGQISKDGMLKISDNHSKIIQNILTKYDDLKPPELFIPSVQLFRLSTQTQLESDKYLREWIQTGDNSTRSKSDELLQQSFQYEMSALQSYNTAKSKGLQ